MDTIAILGSDGYTGWPLACHLLDQGYDVVGIDNFSRRGRAEQSVTPIADHERRAEVANEAFDGDYIWQRADLCRHGAHLPFAADADIDAVVNLAQIPAAPFSMQSPQSAWDTQRNNVKGSLNLLWALKEQDRDIPLVQLATMGEYGQYPDGVPIPEGFLDDGRPAPKDPPSFYHASKVQMTTNTRFAAKTWGLPVTEIYQGIVYGLPRYDDPALQTRFDVGACWGTVLNRFTAQAAIDHPLTVYGSGGQKRAMLSLRDCIQCLTLALEHPPSLDGPPWRYPYRAINQFDESHRVIDLATMVADKTGAAINHFDNPRIEDDSPHYYEPEREVLDELGYEPTASIEDEFEYAFGVVSEHTDRIADDEIEPATEWA